MIDNNQPIPSPAQSGITAGSPFTYWTGAISSWGVSLVKRGYTVHTNTAAFTYGNTSNVYDLANYDVLIIPEPNTVFTAAEKTAIFNFIQNGGGVVAVADHWGADRNNDGWDSPEIFNDLDPTQLLGVRFGRAAGGGAGDAPPPRHGVAGRARDDPGGGTHAHAAGQRQQAYDMAERCMYDAVTQGYHGTVLEWLEDLPESDLDSRQLLLRHELESFRREMALEFATSRKDLDQGLTLVRLDFEAGLAAVRNDMEAGLGALRKDMESGLATLRSDMEHGLAGLRKDMDLMRKSMTIQLGSMYVVGMGLLFAALLLT